MKKNLLAVAVMTASIGLSVTTVRAQEQSESLALEEIIVTARKRQESLQDISVSVTAVTAEMIAARAMRDLSDIAQATAGLTYETYSTSAINANPVIRGMAQVDITSQLQNTAVFLDGVYLQRQGMMNPGLVEMGRVEVVKGPQSALYGRNAFSGAINYVTKRPGEELEGRLSLTYGSDERQDFSAAIGGPIIPGKLLGRVSAAVSEFDGFADNAHPASGANIKGVGSKDNLGGWDDTTASLSLVATPNNSIGAMFTYFHSELEYELQPYYIIDGAKSQANALTTVNDLNCNLATVAGPSPFLPPVTDNTLWCGEMPAANPELGKITVDPRGYGADNETDIVSLRTNWDINAEFTLNYQFGWTDFTSRTNGGVGDRNPLEGSTFFGGIDFSTVPISAKLIQSNILNGQPVADLETTSHDIRLDWNGGGDFSGRLGIYYSDVEDSSWNSFWFMDVCHEDNIDACELAVSGDTRSPLADGIPPLAAFTLLQGTVQHGAQSNLIDRTDEIISAYGELIWHINDVWTLRTEARYTEEDREAEFIKDFLGQTEVCDDDVCVPVYRKFDETFDYFTPRVSLEWQLAERSLLYANAAKGVKSGGFNNAEEVSQQTFEEEQNWTYEIGTKNTLYENRLRLNAAIYFIDWTDIQNPVPPESSSDFAVTVIGNEGDAESLGFEIEGTWLFTEQTTIDFGYAWNETEWEDGTIDISFANEPTSHWFCDGVVCPADGSIGGNQVPRTSEHEFIVGFNHRRFLDNGVLMTARIDFNWRDKQYLDNMNLSYIDDRLLSNLSILVDAPKSWELILWGKNIFDEDFVSNSFNVAQFNKYVVSTGAERSYGATLSYNF